jgi:hypothetical protein
VGRGPVEAHQRHMAAYLLDTCLDSPAQLGPLSGPLGPVQAWSTLTIDQRTINRPPCRSLLTSDPTCQPQPSHQPTWMCHVSSQN